MVKNPTKTNEQSVNNAAAPIKVDLSKPLFQDAIMQGKALINDGKTKADAARLIFSMIKEEEKDVVVAAFEEGATLTPKGALTYWYNCRRRAAKEAKKTAEKK